MQIPAAGRIKIRERFWTWLRKLGIEPTSVLRRARLPLTLLTDDKSLLTTAQFFSIWRALGDLSSDPALGLKLGAQLQPAVLPPAMLAAHYARDYRDALTRYARFMQLRKSCEISLRDLRDECIVEWRWTHATEEEPPLLTDVTFAMLVEMGRRGTEQPLNPKRVELKRSPEHGGVQKAYFDCPVKFRAARNMLIFHAADLDRPFVTYNAELLEMLRPQLENGAEQARIDASVAEQVQWILKRILAGGRPHTSAVAKELGLSVRTLQRRIVDEGTTFRELLAQVRQELWREYLAQRGMQIDEMAFLLGYADTNAFYRAFRTCEGTTPAQWRVASNGSRNR